MSLVEMRIGEDGLPYEYSKVENSIRWLKSFEPPEGYYLAFSGGKDSVVLKALADMAGVKYDAHYSVTSVDPPELVQFIKKYHPDVSRDIPREDPDDPNSPPITMWNLIPRKATPPTRVMRYCCEFLKEACGEGRVTLTGVRWDESSRRKNNRHLVDIGGAQKTGRLFLMNDDAESRQEVENCYKMRKTLVNPIIDWTDEDIWEFIHENNLPYCSLYDKGYKRLGCIGCPMNNNAAELEAYPKYKRMYLRAFEKMIEERRRRGLKIKDGWATPEGVMSWWLGESKFCDENQMTILELGLDEDYFKE